MSTRLTKGDDVWTGWFGIDDTVFGDDGSDVLDGGGGNDSLWGGNGIDYLYGRDGDDVLHGDDGAEHEVGTGDDFLYGGEGNDTLFGGAGVDRLDGENGDDRLFGQSGRDYLFGGRGADDLFGGDGDDELNALRGHSIFRQEVDSVADALLDGGGTLDGGAGQDRIMVGHDFAGTMTIIGGDGRDDLVFDGDTNVFSAAIRSQVVNVVDMEAHSGLTPFGGHIVISEIENIAGSNDYNDVFRGDDNDNILQTFDGDDRLEGRGGADSLWGGDGAHDVADYVSSIFGVDVDLTRATQIGGDAEGDDLSGIEDLDGSRTADTLRGDGGANYLFGNQGGDVLEGRGGADTLNGGIGTDTASYESSSARVVVRLDDAAAGTASIAYGGDAEGDVLMSIENLVGSSRDDILIGNSGANRIEAGNGADTLYGLEAADTLFGEAGDDSISGGDGNDFVDGGFGNDLLYGDDGIDTVSFESWDPATRDRESIRIELGQGSQAGSAVRTAISIFNIVTTETDTLTSFENVHGSNHSETIVGNSGANLLEGRDGNDVLQGNGGSDTLDGGAGTDTATYESNSDRVIINLGAFADGSAIEFAIVPTQGEIIASVDTLRGIENARGSVFGDQITGNGLDNVLDGHAGADLLQGAAGNDTYIVDNAADMVIEAAGQGLDTVRTSVSYALNASEVENLETTNASGTAAINLTGNALANTITGNAGQNIIDGGTGADIIDGRGGNDTVSYANNTAHVQVELLASGTDSIGAEFAGSPGQDVLVSVDILRSIENVRGSAFNDIIDGNELDNILDGNGGADTLTGRAGNDTYVVDNALDLVIERANEGRDTIQSSVTYGLSDNVENLTLTGKIGASGIGNGLANTIVGNAAANFIDGGAGVDTLTGGGDNDLFVFHAGEANGDTVTDFAGNGAAAGDRIQFIGYGPGATLSAVDDTHWQVTYHGGLDHDVIAFANGAAIHPTDFVFL